MATNTTNFGLVKPAQDDFYDIDVQNDNMDIIDEELKKSKDHIDNKSNPHGVTASQIGAVKTTDVVNGLTSTDTAKPLSAAQGKALNDKITTHTGNTSNPHSVTKSQVGLGNVPNVATNDQTPTYSEASSLTALTSGEKLSVAFSKIKKAVADLISHLANKSNPHAVTKGQVGLSEVENKSSATIRGELTKANVTTALGYTPPTQDTVYTLPTGNASTLGGVKLSDDTNNSSNNVGGVAATPLAVKSAYDRATTALSTANAAMPKAGGTFTNEVATTEYFKFVLDDTHYVSIGKSDSDNFVIAVNNNGTWVDIIRAGKDGSWFDGAIASYVDTHTSNKSNPHGVTKSQVGLGNVTNNAQMPIAGGTFTGNAKAYSTNRSGECLRNIDVRNSAGTSSQSTNFIRFDRKS